VPIHDDIVVQLKESMRARDKARTTALRNIRAAFIAKMKEDNSTALGDEDCTEILRRLSKQRRESIAAYQQGGRDDLVAQETAELAVVDSFLPSLADQATTREWVAEAIAASGAESPRDLGKVMGAIMRAHRGEVDGGLANRLARELLTG